MLVGTEDLLPLIAPISWLIFCGVMPLRYPTQPLKVAANALAYSILKFVSSDNSRRAPTYQTIVLSFANLRPPTAYTIIKDRKQVEHFYSTLIRARARYALPLPLEIHPIWWLHIPLNPETGAVNDFPGWDIADPNNSDTTARRQRSTQWAILSLCAWHLKDVLRKGGTSCQHRYHLEKTHLLDKARIGRPNYPTAVSKVENRYAFGSTRADCQDLASEQRYSK